MNKFWYSNMNYYTSIIYIYKLKIRQQRYKQYLLLYFNYVNIRVILFVK